MYKTATQPFEHYHVINGNSNVTLPQGPQENEDPSFKIPSNLKQTTQPIQKPKSKEGAPAQAHKSIAWDGPVWCSRFGRFENKEDAIADDANDWPQEGLYRCEKHQCDCRVPMNQHSYVSDLKRRVEPMVESIVRLEQVVEKLVKHFVVKGEDLAHLGHQNGHDHGKSSENTAERRENTTSHNHHVPIEESLRRLEARVESVVNHIVEKDKDNTLLRDGFGKAGKPDEGTFFAGSR